MKYPHLYLLYYTHVLKFNYFTVVNNILSFFLFFYHLQITTEKLDELKDKVPRAGPKYRLGMYFETIHDLPQFDEICAEDGYSSYWETDTEIDSEFGNLIFSNVTGDSASVICIDEAMDLLALRERQQHLIDASAELKPEQVEEHFLERSTDSKRSASSRQSRQSHHSGSDGTYEGGLPPPPLPARRPSTMTSTATSTQDHIYETLDDCKEDYEAEMAIYVSKGSDGSRESTDSTAKPAAINDDSDKSSSAKGASRSPTKLVKQRSLRSPQRPEVQIRHRRKYSEGESPNRKKKQHTSEKVAPQNGYQVPIKGYALPIGVPQEYAEYMALPLSPSRRWSGDCSSRKPSHTDSPPSLIIKHKGKTFMIPVMDKKLQQKLEKSKQGPTSTQPRLQYLPHFSLQPKHNTLNTLAKSNTASSIYQGTVNLSRSHASPPKMEPADQAQSHKRRSKQPAQPSGQPQGLAKQVTHYGVV